MLNKLLNAVDDFIIDRLAQPVVDAVRNTTGWSKQVPVAIMLLFSSATLVLVGQLVLTMGSGLFPVLFSIPAFLVSFSQALLAGLLLWLESNDKTGERQETMSSSRMQDRDNRRTLPLYWLAHGVVALSPYPPSAVEAQLLIQLIFLWASFTMGSLYLLACTDMPPGRNVFQRMLDWVHEAFHVSTPVRMER